MNVLVVIVFMSVGAMTDFISYAIASVFKNMNQVMFAKQ
jgi:Na+-transporting methylmalonyl-CoA/oxaloacetate decarboxylase beta subunit